MVDFSKHTTTRKEMAVISKIAKRAIALRLATDKMGLEMDLDCVHNTVKLRLDALLGADKFNFAHDVCGIQNTIDRDTGELKNCFLPRFSA